MSEQSIETDHPTGDTIEFDLREIHAKPSVPKITSILRTYYQYDSQSEPFETVQSCQIDLGKHEEEEPYERTLRIRKENVRQRLDLGWLSETKVSLTVLTASASNEAPIRLQTEIKSEWGLITLLPPGASTMLYRDSYSSLGFVGREKDKLHLVALPG